MTTTAAQWAEARAVLCVRLDTLGDVLMTSPALGALRGAVPGRRVTLLTSSAGAEAGSLVPSVDTVIVYDAPWLKASPRRPHAAPDHAMIERLALERFDAAVIFTVNSQSPLPAALMCHLAGIPLRLAHCRENPYGLLTDWVPEPERDLPVRHEVRRQLDLVARVGCAPSDERLTLEVPEAARRAIEGVLCDAGLAGAARWAVVHVGASAPSRRYPPESFAAAARLLVADGVELVFTGSAHEVELVERVRRGIPSLSLAGSLSLGELAALLERAPVLVSNNSGPVHVAAAVGTPVVDLYALTNPQHTPWGVPNKVLSHDVECRWCLKSVCPMGHHDCLRLVPPEEVAGAARALLATRARAAG